jgi:hypothetical protein
VVVAECPRRIEHPHDSGDDQHYGREYQPTLTASFCCAFSAALLVTIPTQWWGKTASRMSVTTTEMTSDPRQQGGMKKRGTAASF